ncbi:MAG: DUF1186 domain-containing protein [Rhodopirellula sp.]|nr:DUF1186 domain-containing protein [Rhodopirellula sp.]
MAENLSDVSAVDALMKRGITTSNVEWTGGVPDYVSEYSLTAEHIPALIEAATTWVEGPSDDPAVYGQVHAWRALGQMRAVEAVQPLLDVQDELDDLDDDWYLEEFQHVFGLIGPPAIDQLAAFLADETRGDSPRQNAASGLVTIARRFPETRGQVLDILTAELGRHEGDGGLNGHLVANLLDLDAVEAAEHIERAFAANVVDPTIIGHWGNIRRQLNVAGLGLAPDESPGWTTISERIAINPTGGFFDPLPAVVDPVADERKRALALKKQEAAKRQVKAKRKQQKMNKKRNRRPR